MITITGAPAFIVVGQAITFAVASTGGNITSVVSSNVLGVIVESFNVSTSTPIGIRGFGGGATSATIIVQNATGESAQVSIPVKGISTDYIGGIIGLTQNNVGLFIALAGVGGLATTIKGVSRTVAFKIAENAASLPDIEYGELIPNAMPKWNICSPVSPAAFKVVTRSSRKSIIAKLKNLAGTISDDTTAISDTRYFFGLGFFYDKASNRLYDHAALRPSISIPSEITMHYLNGSFWPTGTANPFAPSGQGFNAQVRIGALAFENLVGGQTAGQIGIVLCANNVSTPTEVGLNAYASYSSSLSRTGWVTIPVAITSAQAALFTANTSYRPKLWLRQSGTADADRAFLDFLFAETASAIVRKIMHTSPALGAFEQDSGGLGTSGITGMTYGNNYIMGTFSLDENVYHNFYVTKRGSGVYSRMVGTGASNPSSTTPVSMTWTLAPYQVDSAWDYDAIYDFLATFTPMLTGSDTINFRVEVQASEGTIILVSARPYGSEGSFVVIGSCQNQGGTYYQDISIQSFERGMQYEFKVEEVATSEDYVYRCNMALMYDGSWHNGATYMEYHYDLFTYTPQGNTQDLLFIISDQY